MSISNFNLAPRRSAGPGYRRYGTCSWNSPYFVDRTNFSSFRANRPLFPYPIQGGNIFSWWNGQQYQTAPFNRELDAIVSLRSVSSDYFRVHQVQIQRSRNKRERLRVVYPFSLENFMKYGKQYIWNVRCAWVLLSIVNQPEISQPGKYWFASLIRIVDSLILAQIAIMSRMIVKRTIGGEDDLQSGWTMTRTMIHFVRRRASSMSGTRVRR